MDSTKRKASRIVPKPIRKPKSSIQRGFGFEMPPDRELVEIYFDQKDMEDQAGPFYNFYDDTDWRSASGTPLRNWKVLAADWIFNYRQQLKLEQRLRTNQSAFYDL
jgi:hypothetical protein